MKKILLYAACCLELSWVSAQIDTVDCNIYTFYVAAYGDDAKRLAIREIYKTNNIYIDSIPISIHSYVPLLKDLTAIYRAGLPDITDSIYSIYNIHTFPVPYLEDIFVIVDTSQIWVKNWITGNLLSGNDTIDDLMNNYSLVRQNFSSSFGFLIHTTTLLNARALAQAFKKVSGVNDAFESAVFGDGSDIIMNDSIAFKEYIFEKAWGDCPSGCINHHYWKFHVYQGCAVEYIGSGGTPLQFSTSVAGPNITSSNFSLYPNPASDIVTISIDEYMIGSALVISDITGRKMAAIELQTTNTKLETDNLSSGVYFISVTHNGRTSATKKLVLQKTSFVF